MCPGGQDGACKHVAAALYSLHDCLYPASGPTDTLCYWKKKQTTGTKPKPIKEVKIAKAGNLLKKQGLKKREGKYEGPCDRGVQTTRKRGPIQDNIDFDPRLQADQTTFSEKAFKDIKGKLSTHGCVAGMFIIIVEI